MQAGNSVRMDLVAKVRKVADKKKTILGSFIGTMAEMRESLHNIHPIRDDSGISLPSWVHPKHTSIIM